MFDEAKESLAKFILSDGSVVANYYDFAIPTTMPAIGAVPSLTENIAVPKSRRCCAIGWSCSTTIPINTEAIDLEHLGAHLYGGPSLNPRSNNFAAVSLDSAGHIYTRLGGIVDLGHLRDHADLARYVATRVAQVFKAGGVIPLPNQAGKITATIKPSVIALPSAYQAAALGALISWDYAVWHEINTFGSWQDYSSFSPEDNYSNLLGAYIGFLACLDPDNPYNSSITLTLRRILEEGLFAQPKRITLLAVDAAEGKWFGYFGDSAARPPHTELFLIRRHMQIMDRVEPWLVSEIDGFVDREVLDAVGGLRQKKPILLPQFDETNTALRDYYTFEIQDAAIPRNDIIQDLLDAQSGSIFATNYAEIVDRMRSAVTASDPNADRPGSA